MKDNFSVRSDNYARYRPQYPPELYEFINSNVQAKENAWDCGTGNGQVASVLAVWYKNVYASDISAQQIENAISKSNIFYSLQPAEETNFKSNFFDLIVVAQAIHWFDFDRFFSEVIRTARKNALFCAVGYGLMKISEDIDKLVLEFHDETVGPYWDVERKYIDSCYKTIPFPFEELQVPDFFNTLSWTKEHFMSYIRTWSAVKHFIRQEGTDPTTQLYDDLDKIWKDDEIKMIKLPVFMRAGRIK